MNEAVFDALLGQCVALSATFYEDRKLGKSLAIGDREVLQQTCTPWSRSWSAHDAGASMLTFEELRSHARDDGGLLVDGESGQLIGKAKQKQAKPSKTKQKQAKPNKTM